MYCVLYGSHKKQRSFPSYNVDDFYNGDVLCLLRGMSRIFNVCMAIFVVKGIKHTLNKDKTKRCGMD